jgi:DHA1 family bicyclomycin/chloramphenicol resistance-like MFS transporter
MTHHAKIAGTASALLGTIQFFIAAVSTTVLALIETSSALPMAIVIAGCGLSATLLNFLTLNSRRIGEAHA